MILNYLNIDPTGLGLPCSGKQSLEPREPWDIPPPMHWDMFPDIPMGEDMYGTGDMLGPIPWWGEFKPCIGGLN